MDLAFSGAGFMGVYYFGAVDILRRYIPKERIGRVAGASAGSLIGAYFLCDSPLHSSLKAIVDMLAEIRRRPLGVFDRNHQIVDILPKVLDELLPEDAHKRVSGRLYVVMTRLKDMKKVVVSEFETRQELIEALNCSSFIPVWSGNHVPTYKGVRHIDGGFKDNMPIFDENTIRICCFAGDTDIKPYEQPSTKAFSVRAFNMPFFISFGNLKRLRRAVLPASTEALLSLVERGFQDAREFVLAKDLIMCDACYRRDSRRPSGATISPAISRSPSWRRPQWSAAGKAAKRRPPTSDHDHERDHERENASPRAPAPPKLVFTVADDGQELAAKTAAELEEEEAEAEAKRVANWLAKATRRKSLGTTLQMDDEKPSVEGAKKRGRSNTSADLKALADELQARMASSAETHASAHNGKADARKQRKKERAPPARSKFVPAPSPLPSCPPSPNLNRHCDECIRLRQEARADGLAQEIRHEIALQLKEHGSHKEDTLARRLRSPIGWLKRMKRRDSYCFKSAEAQAGAGEMCAAGAAE